MVLGFNHNIQYKGEVFHIQTEDSGVDSPHIITLLYLGGTIISSKKTSYADIIKIDDLERVVEDLMKEQHKDMLRRLKAGEFDDKAFGRASAAPEESSPNDCTRTAADTSFTESPSCAPSDVSLKKQQSLDEIILDYLIAGDTE
jgi:hypothetical protein